MRRALLSVTDKSGLVDFAKGLVGLGFELVSTGGTSKALRDGGLAVKDVSEVTGFPEMLEGRIKTLHPMIHGGILADMRHESHRQAIAEAGIHPIELVVVNLYAFEQTVAAGKSRDETVEAIDIGGPTMVRAAAKNHASVAIVVDPLDYSKVLEQYGTSMTAEFKLKLAAKAYRHTAFYDSMVSRWMSEQAGDPTFTETMSFGFRERSTLRYGENPHQKAAVYIDPFGQKGVAKAQQLSGKELSHINFQDADAAWELVNDLPEGACAIIKHCNPCGAAVGETLAESYRLAKQSDPISAFGGIVAYNCEVDGDAARAMTEKNNFLEVIVAPGYTEEARDIIQNRSGWGQNVRLLVAEVPPASPYLSLMSIRGGVLIQESDEEPPKKWETVTSLHPSEDQLKALEFAWRVIPHVKSNAIVVCTANRLVGVGAGQMNRVQSVRLALDQAGELAKGAALASDAFFPFPDSVETAAAAGIGAIIEPGGSVKDQDVIAKANELGIPMVFTGVRHFRH